MTRRSSARKSRTAQASLAENEVENVQPHVDETTTMNPHDGVEGVAPHDGSQADDAHLSVTASGCPKPAQKNVWAAAPMTDKTNRSSASGRPKPVPKPVENVQPHVDETTTMNPHDGVEGVAPRDGSQADDAHLSVTASGRPKPAQKNVRAAAPMTDKTNRSSASGRPKPVPKPKKAQTTAFQAQTENIQPTDENASQISPKPTTSSGTAATTGRSTGKTTGRTKQTTAVSVSTAAAAAASRAQYKRATTPAAAPKRTAQLSSGPGSIPLSDDENNLGGRSRVPTQRAAEAAGMALQAKAARVVAKEKQARRAEERSQQLHSSAAVEREGDSKTVRRLKALLFASNAERDHAKRQIDALKNKAPAVRKTKDTTPRPLSLKTFKVVELREMLGLADDASKPEWNHIRTTTRDMMICGNLDYGCQWKEQHISKLTKIYAAIEEILPALKQFRNNWATAYLVQEAFSSHKSYLAAKKNKNSYRMRHRPGHKSADEDNHMAIDNELDDDDHMAIGDELGDDDHMAIGDMLGDDELDNNGYENVDINALNDSDLEYTEYED